MSDAWRYAVWPDQDQGQGHGASEVPKIALFQLYLLCHLQWQLANDCWFLNWSTISKFDPAVFLIFVLLFVSCDLEIRGVSAVSPSKTKLFRFKWILVCKWRSMSDARWYAVWPDPRSRSWLRVLESHSTGVDRQSRTGLIFKYSCSNLNRCCGDYMHSYYSGVMKWRKIVWVVRGLKE